MDITDLATRIQNGERRALARAITLVESGRADHRAQAVELLEQLARAPRQALRIGLSGTPGVGKSTFIEAFGRMLTGQGLRVAVLAVDPSSARSGGSILGDKTRMEQLSRDPTALELGGAQKEATVLFADIRKFTTISEQMDPQQVVGLLADSEKEDRQSQLTGHGHGHAALGGTIELGQEDAVDLGHLGEFPGLQHRIVAGRSVEHE